MLLLPPTLNSLLLVYDLPVILRQKYVSLYHFQAIKIYMIEPFLFSFLCSYIRRTSFHSCVPTSWAYVEDIILQSTWTFFSSRFLFSSRLSRNFPTHIFLEWLLVVKIRELSGECAHGIKQKVSVECVPKIKKQKRFKFIIFRERMLHRDMPYFQCFFRVNHFRISSAQQEEVERETLWEMEN